VADRQRLRECVPRSRAAAERRKKRLKARAEWHFGGGPEYCVSCTRLDRPCARGETGCDGRRCPYLEHAPLTDAGWQAWDVLTRCAGQLRLAPNGAAVIGIDFTAAIALATALGYEARSVAELLPAGEVGLITALNERLASQRDEGSPPWPIVISPSAWPSSTAAR
jgi:hypothetical protein